MKYEKKHYYKYAHNLSIKGKRPQNKLFHICQRIDKTQFNSKRKASHLNQEAMLNISYTHYPSTEGLLYKNLKNFPIWAATQPFSNTKRRPKGGPSVWGGHDQLNMTVGKFVLRYKSLVAVFYVNLCFPFWGSKENDRNVVVFQYGNVVIPAPFHCVQAI